MATNQTNQPGVDETLDGGTDGGKTERCRRFEKRNVRNRADKGTKGNRGGFSRKRPEHEQFTHVPTYERNSPDQND